jgi:hypothetical protein
LIYRRLVTILSRICRLVVVPWGKSTTSR